MCGCSCAAPRSFVAVIMTRRRRRRPRSSDHADGEQQQQRIAIVGAGLTGLSTAISLEQRAPGFRGRVTVFERDDDGQQHSSRAAAKATDSH